MSGPPDGLPPLREVIARHSLAAKKSLGQNFLLDLNLTGRIARAAGPLDGVTVVEIGPGPGGLTRALLAEGARKVIAVERDERAIAALGEIAQRYPGRLDVIAGDALDDRSASRTCSSGPARIVANLPYNIATPLLVSWLTTEPWPPWFDRLVLMFQREVAERIVAPPGSKQYGRLSVLAGWRTRAKILFDVHPSAFVPPPKVTSSVVELVPRADAAGLRPGAARARHRGRVRPAPQDAAPEPEIAGPRSAAAARRGRHRAHRARRGNSGRGLRRADPRACRTLRSKRMTQLRRLSLTAYEAPLCETIVDCPAPQGSEVLVRIERCGVCHSDLHMQDGYFLLGDGKKLDVRAGRTLPFTLGHEIAGTVESAGPQAAGATPGAKVAVYPWIGCGKCAACRAGEENLCSTNRHLGISADGGFASHVLVPHPRYLIDYAPLSRVVRRRADVLRPHRLFRAQAACASTPRADRRCWSAWAASA